VIYYRINQKGKLSLIQINGVLNRPMLEHNKTLVILYALFICFWSWCPFFTVVHTILWKTSFTDREKILSLSAKNNLM